MKYSKIVGTFFKFEGEQRISTGVQYAKREMRLDEQKLVISTFDKGKFIETEMLLGGPRLLDFTSKSDDPRLPVMTGHFFNSDYEECVLTASLPDQKIIINGVVTKLGETHALSTKTLTDATTGIIVAVMQERVELITASEYEIATSSQ